MWQIATVINVIVIVVIRWLRFNFPHQSQALPGLGQNCIICRSTNLFPTGLRMLRSASQWTEKSTHIRAVVFYLIRDTYLIGAVCFHFYLNILSSHKHTTFRNALFRSPPTGWITPKGTFLPRGRDNRHSTPVIGDDHPFESEASTLSLVV